MWTASALASLWRCSQSLQYKEAVQRAPSRTRALGYPSIYYHTLACTVSASLSKGGVTLPVSLRVAPVLAQGGEGQDLDEWGRGTHTQTHTCVALCGFENKVECEADSWQQAVPFSRGGLPVRELVLYNSLKGLSRGPFPFGTPLLLGSDRWNLGTEF